LKTQTATLGALAAVIAVAASAQATHPFSPVQSVLQSPRCMNCHPAGDAPLQTDLSRPHKQNIKRTFPTLGGSCATCHQEANTPGKNMPPGAPHWGLPPKEMVFEGKTARQLCTDLKDPAKNGNRSLADLKAHVAHDPLVLWGFAPGDGRTLPPLTHAQFVAAFDAWAAQGGPCP
jgi:hypothetical protein